VKEGCEFKVFTEPANDPDGRVAALRVPGGAVLTRKQIDDYAARGKYGAKGLAWMRIEISRRAGRRQLADRQVPRRGRVRRILQPRRRAAGDMRVLRCRSYKTVCDSWARCDEGRQGLNLGREQLEAAVGDRLPDVRVGRRGEALTSPCIIRSPRRRSTTSPTCAPMPRPRCRAATTWCSTATRSAAVRSASIARTCSRRCSTCSASARKRRKQVRLPAGRAALRRTAARRHRLRHRPHRRADGRHRSIRDVIAFPKTTSAPGGHPNSPSRGHLKIPQ
jgi:hypothetical protein